jgi:hypothetical protein
MTDSQIPILCIGGHWDGKLADYTDQPYLKVIKHKQLRTPTAAFIRANTPEIVSTVEYDIYYPIVFTLEGGTKRHFWRYKKLTVEEMFDKLISSYKLVKGNTND